jgi:hypothetical protein
MLLSQLSGEEVSSGLDSTVEQFSVQLESVKDPNLSVRSLRILVGEEEFDMEDANERSLRYQMISKHLESIRKLMELYGKQKFDDSYCASFDDRVGSATCIHNKGDGVRATKVFCNETPLDALEYFRRTYGYFKEIVSKGSTEFYDIIEWTIDNIWERATAIFDEIKAIPEFQELIVPDDKWGCFTDNDRAKLIVYGEEFLRKDITIPLVEDMKLVYETMGKLIEGISEKYAGNSTD